MSGEIVNNFAQQFPTNFIMLAQQRRSRLLGTVRNDPQYLVGKHGHFDRVGATEFQRKTGRHSDTPLIETPHSRRRISLEDWNNGDLVDHSDLRRMLANPQDAYMMNFVMGAGRLIDDVIIAAGNGNSVSIDEDDASSTIALPSSQKVVHGSAGLTVGKIEEAREILESNDVPEPEEEKRYLGVTSKQLTNLFNTTEIKSRDYNAVQALYEGKVNYFHTFNIIRVERLATDSSSHRLCPAYTQTAIGLAFGRKDGTTSMEDGGQASLENALMTRVAERADKNFSIQVYAEVSLGAVRVEEEKYVQIACVES